VVLAGAARERHGLAREPGAQVQVGVGREPAPDEEPGAQGQVPDAEPDAQGQVPDAEPVSEQRRRPM
jgi:hypothetical protein